MIEVFGTWALQSLYKTWPCDNLSRELSFGGKIVGNGQRTEDK